MRSILIKRKSAHCLKGKHSSAKGEALEYTVPPKTPKRPVMAKCVSHWDRRRPACPPPQRKIIPNLFPSPRRTNFYPLPFTLYPFVTIRTTNHLQPPGTPISVLATSGPLTFPDEGVFSEDGGVCLGDDDANKEIGVPGTPLGFVMTLSPCRITFCELLIDTVGAKSSAMLSEARRHVSAESCFLLQ